VMALQLPVQKREVCSYTSDLGAGIRPQTPDTRSPSALSTETFGDGRDTDEASTPRNLWPATPTPSPRYLEAPLSFLVPLVPGPCTDSMVPACQDTDSRYTQLNVNAKAFVPAGNYSCTPLGQRCQAPSDPEPVANAAQGVAAEVKEEPCVPSSVSQGGFVASLEVPNMGSALHSSGECKPCAWFWKSRGCTNGYACDYCHLCPAGALKERKKAKVAAIRSGVLAPQGPARDRSSSCS